MIVTTTPSVEGKKIVEYKGIVFGEVVSGVNFLKDFAAGMRNFFGGRSGSYEEVDYEVLGADNGMLMVSVSGTAVVCE